MCRLWPGFQGQDKRGLESSAQFRPLTGSWRVNCKGHVRRGHLGPRLQHQEQWQRLNSSVGSGHMRAPRAGVVLQDARLVCVPGPGV